jgi:hypothetical protein
MKTFAKCVFYIGIVFVAAGVTFILALAGHDAFINIVHREYVRAVPPVIFIGLALTLIGAFVSVQLEEDND